MPITREEAGELGLEIYPLISWCFDLGNPRRLKPDEDTENLVYGLDDFQVSTKVYRRTKETTPPDVLTCEQTGLPLRPLYINLKDGIVKRTIPISWNEGVDYYEWKSLKESL